MRIILTANSVNLLSGASRFLSENGLKNCGMFTPLDEDLYKVAAKKEGRDIWYAFIHIIAKTHMFANHFNEADIVILLTEQTFNRSMQFVLENSKI